MLTKADKVVTVAPDGARRLGRLGNRNVGVIYNGFDRDDDTQAPVKQNDKFSITYLGVLSKIQNPENLWQILGELVKEDVDFSKKLQINMIGQIDSSVARSIEGHGLGQHVTYSPDGDAARILKETQAGVTVRFEDRERMKETVKGLYQKYLENGLPNNSKAEIERYSRRELTKQYAKILNQIES